MYFWFIILAFLLWFPTQIASVVPFINFSFDNLLVSISTIVIIFFYSLVGLLIAKFYPYQLKQVRNVQII